MISSAYRRLLPAFFVLAATVPALALAQASAQLTPSTSNLKTQAASPSRPPWWKDEAFRKDLGLTTEQSGRIESIFQAFLPQLRQGYDDLNRRENKLSQLIEGDADESLIVQQIDRVELARSSLNKTRTLMHLRMRQLLTSEQRLRFKTLYEHRQAAQRGHAASPRPEQ